MSMKASKTFSYSMDVAWQALHRTSEIEIEENATIGQIDETTWIARVQEDGDGTASVSTYHATFDEAEHIVRIEGTNPNNDDRDHLILTLTEAAGGVELTAELQFDFGLNLFARAATKLFGKIALEAMSERIFTSFDKLCREISA